MNDDSYFKDLYAKNTSGGFKEGGVGISEVNSHMIAPMKKGSYGKLFTMLFYIHVGTC